MNFNEIFLVYNAGINWGQQPMNQKTITSETDQKQFIEKSESISLENYSVTPEQIQKNDETQFETFGFDRFVKKCTTLFYGERGVGKTLATIMLANSDNISKPYIIPLEDYNGLQMSRYRDGLKNPNAEIMTRKLWDKWHDFIRNEILAIIGNYAMVEAIQDHQMSNSFLKSLKTHLKRLKSEFGLDGHLKHSFLTSLCMLVAKLKEQGIDLLIIDSFHALQQNSRFQRKELEFLLRTVAEAELTLILVHHTNKKGELEGIQELQNVVDGICRIDKVGKDENSGDDFIRITMEKSRFIEKSSIFLRKRRITESVAEFSEVEGEEFVDFRNNEDKNVTLKSQIQKILKDHKEDTILFETLLEGVLLISPGTTNGSVKNILKELLDQKMVDKAEGNSWTKIKILVQ